MVRHVHDDSVKPTQDDMESARDRAWHKLINTREGKIVLGDIIFSAEFCHFDIPSITHNDATGTLAAYNEGARQVGVRIIEEIKKVDKQVLCDIFIAWINADTRIDDG